METLTSNSRPFSAHDHMANLLDASRADHLPALEDWVPPAMPLEENNPFGLLIPRVELASIGNTLDLFVFLQGSRYLARDHTIAVAFDVMAVTTSGEFLRETGAVTELVITEDNEHEPVILDVPDIWHDPQTYAYTIYGLRFHRKLTDGGEYQFDPDHEKRWRLIMTDSDKYPPMTVEGAANGVISRASAKGPDGIYRITATADWGRSDEQAGCLIVGRTADGGTVIGQSDDPKDGNLTSGVPKLFRLNSEFATCIQLTMVYSWIGPPHPFHGKDATFVVID